MIISESKNSKFSLQNIQNIVSYSCLLIPGTETFSRWNDINIFGFFLNGFVMNLFSAFMRPIVSFKLLCMGLQNFWNILRRSKVQRTRSQLSQNRFCSCLWDSFLLHFHYSLHSVQSVKPHYKKTFVLKVYFHWLSLYCFRSVIPTSLLGWLQFGSHLTLS